MPRPRAIPKQYESAVVEWNSQELSLRAISDRLRDEHGVAASRNAVAATLERLCGSPEPTAFDREVESCMPRALTELERIIADGRKVFQNLRDDPSYGRVRTATALGQVLGQRIKAVKALCSLRRKHGGKRPAAEPMAANRDSEPGPGRDNPPIARKEAESVPGGIVTAPAVNRDSEPEPSRNNADIAAKGGGSVSSRIVTAAPRPNRDGRSNTRATLASLGLNEFQDPLQIVKEIAAQLEAIHPVEVQPRPAPGVSLPGASGLQSPSGGRSAGELARAGVMPVIGPVRH